jgi:hypothetical protein
MATPPLGSTWSYTGSSTLPGTGGTNMAAALIPLIGGGISALGSVFGGKSQANAAQNAAEIQANAAKYATDAQTKSAQQALQFQQQQAAQSLATQNAIQKANYDLYANRQARLSTLGQTLGLAPMQIPNYVNIPGAPALPSTPLTTLGSLVR